MPLADRIRPKNLDELAGQTHLLAPGKPLRAIIESGDVPNMIFYGSSGVGKTTLADIIADRTNMRLRKLNGTSASTADIKAVIAESKSLLGYGGILLYLDEIQYLNKKQQQSLLEHIENGDVTMIASTTENPFFYVYGAILSRCTVFEFKPLSPEEAAPAVRRGFALSGANDVSDEVIRVIAEGCGGDVRKALNAAELCVLTASGGEITAETARGLIQKSSMKYDRSGDEHYDILSAFQKSVRGSDENAALHYLARLILAGDLPSICRRLLVTAAEDIGPAYPNAIAIAKACVDSALQLGFPEARIPLAEAVIVLCTAPKSNSAVIAIDGAIADIEAGKTGEIPRQLQNKHCDGAGAAVKGQHYLYPHDYPNGYVKQQYLPDILKDRVYYKFGDNKNERAARAYRERITGGGEREL
ncbi:MAG: replication-associated recombination protein A [Oscillospiraceae bacterium]|jgi:putative ATPase|nr:replication-associated recombination protein A [Oscillospiraceae bacterium]